MNLVFEPAISLDTQYRTAKHFIVVGAGGNGGYYIPNLARQISIQNKLRQLEGLHPHKITIVDADDVEPKNLNRQNFINRDINMGKAFVMADRYGKAFDLEIDFLDEYLTSEDMLKGIINAYRNHIPVIVGCVDNNKTRKFLYDVYKGRPNTFYLDAGNEEHAGQVVCGFNTGQDLKAVKGGGSIQYFDLPSICDLFPEVLEATDKLPTEMSCAERAESAPQNIYTNQTAGNLLLGFTNTILTSKSTEGKGLKVHAVIFDAETMNQTTKFNKPSVLYPEPPKVEVPAEPVAEVVAEPKAPKKRAPRKKAVVPEVPATEEVPF